MSCVYVSYTIPALSLISSFSFRQVKIWFQNRRSKYKKILKHSPSPTGPPGSQSGGQQPATPGQGNAGMSPGTHVSNEGHTPTPQPPVSQQNGLSNPSQGQQLPQQQQQQHHHHHQEQQSQQHTQSSLTMLAHPPPHLPHHPDSVSPPSSGGATWADISSNGVPPGPPTHIPNAYSSNMYMAPGIGQYSWYSQNIAPHQPSLLT